MLIAREGTREELCSTYNEIRVRRCGKEKSENEKLHTSLRVEAAKSNFLEVKIKLESLVYAVYGMEKDALPDDCVQSEISVLMEFS